MDFDYKEAFSRNIGWISAQEQSQLNQKCVAIAGMGGVGGSHLLTLVRLGIGKFKIADFDRFELANFNRQVGATISSLSKPKVDVLAEKARDINPHVNIEIFNQGIKAQNINEFLDQVDLYIDGLDFFALNARCRVFAACYEKKIPAVTAAPLGMGTALINFLPGKMSFEEYFRLDGQAETEQLLRFFIGLAPKLLHQKYIVDPKTIDLENHKGPSTPMGCELCAGAAASQALKILLNRGKVLAAPHAIQFDAYANKFAHSWRPGGNHNPINRYLLKMARNKILKTDPELDKYLSDTRQMSIVEKILEKARWAPSGDNTQPWRFEIINEKHIVVHGFDTRDHVVYDLQGHASQISIGALLETIAIASTEYGLNPKITRQTSQPDTKPTFDIHFTDEESLESDPLVPHIINRTVQRRPMKTTPLTMEQKNSIENSLPENYHVVWLEGFSKRWDMARLMFLNDKLRLSLKEAFEVHRSIIEWKSRYSEDKIPEKAVGIDYLTGRLMQWTLLSWERVSFMNKYMAGTLAPRIQLAFVPALACGAHFAIVANNKPTTIDDFVNGGRALQRFWLAATKSELHVQPEYTPIVFHEYFKNNIDFSKHNFASTLASNISEKFVRIIGSDLADKTVYLGRIGHSNNVFSRSVRLQLKTLIKSH